ncbi:myelin-associated glycoprotein-like [Discoglossus pictus]
MERHYISVKGILLLFLFHDSACQKWSFIFPQSIEALRGSCVEIPCTFTRPPRYNKDSLIWFLYEDFGYQQIFNNKYPSLVMPKYKGRTFLMGNPTNSCSLRIDYVKEGDRYYPGINRAKNSWTLNDKQTVMVKVRDSLDEPLVRDPGVLTEGANVTISCFAQHTCASKPPSLEWNKDGVISVQHEDLKEGNWRVISEINYYPIFKDHNTELECTVRYPNGQMKHKRYILNIQRQVKSYVYITIFVVGIVCLVIPLLIFLYKRKKKSNAASYKQKSKKDAAQTDKRYTDLLKRAVSSEYVEIKPQSHLQVSSKAIDPVASPEYEIVS